MRPRGKRRREQRPGRPRLPGRGLGSPGGRVRGGPGLADLGVSGPDPPPSPVGPRGHVRAPEGKRGADSSLLPPGDPRAPEEISGSPRKCEGPRGDVRASRGMCAQSAWPSTTQPPHAPSFVVGSSGTPPTAALAISRPSGILLRFPDTDSGSEDRPTPAEAAGRGFP
ncbi:hypothetical protein NDU88_000827 [Pleurodeles waltl]|uniref:Uncharacterized protein n=1 Tax=Pleurodeles waltl TaxID=8319 RepID=A0AAV7WKT7_PLEWA|nr:hypothetical protein NDU88_000827 [Pleurodeles waltl]